MGDRVFAVSMPIGAWHPLLPAALRSLAIQKPRPRVAIMDASGDPRVREALDASGLEFDYRRHGPDKGQAAAIAEGWRNIEGDVLAWLNADDLLMPGAFERADALFSADAALDVVYGDSVIIDIDGNILGVHGQVEEVGDRIWMSNPISQPSCFFKRAAVDRIGGLNETLGFAMDWELWIRLYNDGARFQRIPDILSAVYWGEGTKTSEISPRRLFELARISARYSSPLDAARMLLGVLTQASRNESLLRRLSRRGARAAATGEPALFIAADQHPREEGQARRVLPIINTGARPRSALEIVFDTPHGEVIAGDGDVAQRKDRHPAWDYRPSAPVAPGEAARICLAAVGGPSRLQHIRWIEE